MSSSQPSPPAQRNLLVWDLPTRLFHWVTAGSLIGAAVIALTVKHQSTIFPIHMLLGSLGAVLVLLRLVWGFVGSTHARFRTFVFGPSKIVGYFRGIVSGSSERWLGHNPGSSVAIFAMLGLFLATAVTGALAASAPRWVRQTHPIFAYTLLGVAGAHVIGVLLHTFRHRENIIGAMLDGRKAAEPPAIAIRSSHPLVAAILLVVAGGWCALVMTAYDGATHMVTLPIVGTKILLQPPRKAPPAPAPQADIRTP